MCPTPDLVWALTNWRLDLFWTVSDHLVCCSFWRATVSKPALPARRPESRSLSILWPWAARLEQHMLRLSKLTLLHLGDSTVCRSWPCSFVWVLLNVCTQNQPLSQISRQEIKIQMTDIVPHKFRFLQLNRITAMKNEWTGWLVCLKLHQGGPVHGERSLKLKWWQIWILINVDTSKWIPGNELNLFLRRLS